MSFFFGPGGGFGGFGDSDDDGQNNNNSDNTRFYDILGIKKNATAQQIKKSYRKLARDLHPDKHPGEEDKYQSKFQDLQKAYETLSDPSKRKLYDKFGEQGLSGSSGGQGMSDIFDMFFSGHGGNGRSNRQPKKAPIIRQFLDVTLEDFYNGNEKEIIYERMIICKECNGKGGKKIENCSECNGTGRQTVIQRMGYMSIQTQRECTKCNGEGEYIKNKCKKCFGKKLSKQKKKIDFKIPIGSKHATKHIIRGLGHEIPNAANGDIIIVFRCKEHKIFKRIGADLAIEYNLTLKQALCGYNIKIKHLNGKILKLKSKKGEITSHDQLKVLYNYGMPQKNNIIVKGHLYIKFKIIFPNSGTLSKQQINLIKNILPKSKNEINNEIIDKKMEKLEKEYENKLKENKMEEDNENDFEEDHLYEKLQEIHEEAEDLGNDKPKVTPYSARSAYDEDDEPQNGSSGCRQM